MRIYLYGLILARNAKLVPPHVSGIDGVAVRVLPLGSLAALVGEGDATKSDLNAVRAHDHVMQAVVRAGVTATAVRFGQTFGDETELRRHLDSRTELATQLEKLDGQVEMHLLMKLPAEEPEEAKATSPGTAYLESLRASTRVAGLSLLGALGPVVRSERVEELPRANGVVFAHLIKRDDEQEYRDAIRAYPSLKDATIVGPLPVYALGEVE